MGALSLGDESGWEFKAGRYSSAGLCSPLPPPLPVLASQGAGQAGDGALGSLGVVCDFSATVCWWMVGGRSCVDIISVIISVDDFLLSREVVAAAYPFPISDCTSVSCLRSLILTFVFYDGNYTSDCTLKEV